jgi:hypothetical protein
MPTASRTVCGRYLYAFRSRCNLSAASMFLRSALYPLQFARLAGHSDSLCSIGQSHAFRESASQKEKRNEPMKPKLLFVVPALIALGLSNVACRPAAARPPQAAVQDPVPPPPPPAANAPAPPPPDGAVPPPPPPPRGPGAPPRPACGPEAPPPPRAAVYRQGPASTVRAAIRQFNFGPEGEISGFVLSSGVQVNFPPDFSQQLESVARLKSEVTVTGYTRQTATGKTILDAISVNANGQTIAAPAGPAGPGSAPPPPPPPPADGPQPGPPQN